MDTTPTPAVAEVLSFSPGWRVWFNLGDTPMTGIAVMAFTPNAFIARLDSGQEIVVDLDTVRKVQKPAPTALEATK